jgi:lycopene beta-cyclase
VLGAGCAGLSVALELIDRDSQIGVTIFDKKPSFTNDRTWCGWTFDDSRYEACVSHRWSRAVVRGPRHESTLDLRMHPYRRIPGDAFYARCVEQLEASGRCALRLGVDVGAVEPDEGGVSVTLGARDVRPDDGDARCTTRERFDHVLDGRILPSTVRAFRGPTLIQHFAGHEIETADDAFDPDVVTLMDFDVDQSDGPHFFYVLPFAARRALVEATWMTPAAEMHRFREADHTMTIERYIRRTLGVDRWDVRTREAGSIPMAARAPDPQPHPRWWRIGTAAGAVKPSTGYAFDFIHRDCARVAAALIGGLERPALPRSRFAAWLDRVMLSYLTSQPDAAQHVFPRLMQRCPAERVVRFLNDRATPADYLSVMWAMPRLPIATHVVRSRGGFATRSMPATPPPHLA